MRCFFVSDLHGSKERYEKLFAAIEGERPDAVFLGGDILPFGDARFLEDYLTPRFRDLDPRPRVFLILGNDDPAAVVPAVEEGEAAGAWEYVHGRWADLDRFRVLGYNYVPPTPFHLKDWEKYDVSRYVDPGCVSPEQGSRTVPVEPHLIRYATIQADLEDLTRDMELTDAILLCHGPPYRTALDRAGLDGKMIDHVPLDCHVGSIALKRFIEVRQPLLTLHGHVHESTARTGNWREQLGRTWMMSAAHGGPELALVRFDPEHPERATREHL